MPCETSKNFHCSYWTRPEPKEQQNIDKNSSYYRRSFSVIVILSFVNKGYIFSYFHVPSVSGFYSKVEILIIHDNYNSVLQKMPK